MKLGMKLKRGNNLTKKRETVMMLQKGNYMLNRKKMTYDKTGAEEKRFGIILTN